MKTSIKILAFFMTISAVMLIQSCKDDETVPDGPTVTAPASTTSVQVGEPVEIIFTSTIPGGFKSAAVTAEGGTATVSSPAAGAATGDFTVTFTAGTTPGAGSVSLTVTDNNNKTGVATEAITISASAIPTIAAIPATASVVAGATLTVPNVILTATDGFATANKFTVKVDDAAALDLSSLITTASPATVTITYPTTIQQIGARTLVFTLTDADGDKAEFTHILTVTPPAVPTVIVEANISADVTWTKDKVYELATRVTVLSGATLTIQPGTIVKGQPGTGSNATALLVARGGKLIADGTANEPIIFTSTSDDIVPGLIKSPNLLPTQNGLWGGVIILGDAPISASSSGNQLTEVQIEGIPTSDPNGLYGGNDKVDNSGTIRYISIRHGGTNIGSGNEINGLTLGGVGSGTIIENVEIVANQDDGIEFFGGTVSVKNALVWNSYDDGLDTDQAWNGTVDNFLIVAPNTGSAFELDGPEGTYKDGDHTFKNGTVYAGPAIADLIDFDANSNVKMENIYFYGFGNATAVKEYAAMIAFAGSTSSVAAFQHTLAGAANTDPAVVFLGIEAAKLSAVAVNANTVGATDKTFSWTWARQSGALTSIGL
jgi:hypothetical protein